MCITLMFGLLYMLWTMRQSIVSLYSISGNPWLKTHSGFQRVRIQIAALFHNRQMPAADKREKSEPDADALQRQVLFVYKN